jgi:hypothetical protein
MQHRSGMPVMAELFSEAEPSAEASASGEPLPETALCGETVLVTGSAGRSPFAWQSCRWRAFCFWTPANGDFFA